ncbi:MAG: hypothetical protein NkDv07_0854 [Candidatus Improbicoccus devescovinae]|nr:MAG: hypothetical protein NkDv07_0854 [Candidatus Improbicoccus devescovinae]
MLVKQIYHIKVIFVKNMLDKILNADKIKRESLPNAESLKLKSYEKVKELREKKRKEYLGKARINIGIIKKIEKIRASEKINSIEMESKKSIERLRQSFKDNNQKIIEDIIISVTGQIQ